MRKVAICLLLLVFCQLSTFAQSRFEADEPEWLYVNSTNLDDYYWSPTGRLHSDSGLVRFWIRVALNPENPNALQDFLENRKKRNLETRTYGAYSHSVQLYEVDCLNKKMRILSIADYSKQGALLDRAINNPSNWIAIAPDSIAEMLAVEACPFARTNQRYR